MYRNVENMIVIPITKKMEIVIGIQVCLISQMNFDYKEHGGNKSFSSESIASILCPNVENMIVVPIRKGMEIIMSMQVCPTSWMNFDYKENGGKKSFSCKAKASISCIPMWRT